METTLTLNIVLLLLGVINTVILLILLSYKKNIFEHLSDNNSFQNKLLESIKQSLAQAGKNIDNLADAKAAQDILAKICEEILAKIREEQSALSESRQKAEVLSGKLDEIIGIVKSADKTEDKANKTEDKEEGEPAVNMIAYNDAVLAFDNINRKFYEIRKYPQIVLKLADMLMSGSVEGKADFNGLPDDRKQFSANLQSDIMMFNRNYRQHLVAYLHSVGKEWEECVRNPYNKPFDNEWDENVLGDEIEDGEIVTRVVQLGYEFPDSVKIGRTKSKTL